jgi:hypothetical protein
MTGRDLRAFVIDVQRFRPVAAVVAAALFMLPSLAELAAGNLTAVTFLVRLALALVVCAVPGVDVDGPRPPVRPDACAATGRE